MKPELKQVSVEEILTLRHQVLRPGKPLSTARFEGDEQETTYHFAVILESKIQGCVSFMLKFNPKLVQKPSYQLRGMAIDANCRGQGIGRQLLEYAENQLKLNLVQLIWCNVRISSVEFYIKNAYLQIGEQFDIPGVGPHVMMYKSL